MRSPRLRLAIILAGWVALVVPGALRAGFAGTEVFLPSVGRVTGFGGSEFYTTVWITNLSTTTPVNFQFQFLRTGQANTTPLAFSDTLAAGQTKIYENVVESRFGLTAANGAARIVTADRGEVYVSSRIFEQPPGTDLGSSKGLFFSGVPGSFGLGVGERASLQGVNQGGAQNLRYNFILLEIGGQPATLRVDLKDASGAILANKNYTLQPYEHRQLNVTDILPAIATTNARLEGSVVSGAGKVLFAGAQVTNVSQDPTGFEMSFKGSLIEGNGNGNAAGVLSLNGLTGNVTLVPGNNVTITPSGNALTISAAGGTGGTTTGWALTGNSIIAGYFLGTLNNLPLDFRVNNDRAFRLEPTTGSPNVIGGDSSNSVTAGVVGATIGGGGLESGGNRVTDRHGTIGGGSQNLAGDDAGSTTNSFYATVGGGIRNQAGGESSTVGGGSQNRATGDTATIAGGNFNTATGGYSSITGGNANSAQGPFSTVAGGERNIALGRTSFAAGRRANAGHDGAFVWGDGTDAEVTSTVANQFLVRANGGTSLLRAASFPPGNLAALSVQHGATGEAALLYTSSDLNPFPVLKLVSAPNDDLNNFLECVTFSPTVNAQRCAITGNGVFVGDGSGLTNLWKTTGNAITAGQFLGSTNAQPLDFRANNQRALRLEFSASSPNVIGGSIGNSVSAGVFGAVIGGGGLANDPNRVTANHGTVLGGVRNVAGGSHATVGGGFNNTSSQQAATVAGGSSNTAGGQSASVAGGTGNVADGFQSSIGGGEFNMANGRAATAPGGSNNVAAGDYSFAGGRRAKANHDGAFVWGDSTSADLASSAENQFFVRASGGARFFSNSTLTAGVLLAPGGGAWSSLSDRHVKENVQPWDGREALERLSRVPIASWNYKSQDASIRHVGPMAQDFRAAFGLGEDDRHINSVDTDGVALAAIQALYEMVREKDREIQTLKERLDAIEKAAD